MTVVPPIPDIYQTLTASYAWRASSGGWTSVVGGQPLTVSSGSAQSFTASDSGLNNQPACLFSGSGDYGAAIAALGTNQTLVIVGRTAQNTCDLLATTDGTGAENTGTAIFRYAPGDYYVRALLVGATISAVAPVTFVAIGTFSTSAQTLRINANTAGATAGASAAYSVGNVRVGGNGGGSAVRLTGAVAEVALFNRVLSGADITTLNAALGAKYGITIWA